MSELTQFEKQGLVHLMMSYAGKQDQELGDFEREGLRLILEWSARSMFDLERTKNELEQARHELYKLRSASQK